ncbi:glycoside hydrolase family 15 protein [Planctomyces sp. SH-PL14]|uniref:glycoside hydrolase family 15 protein n=1 Tax=Planctomyces sp. SH-PL14 TaxID=1632864 RepID=UPI00078E94B4|nr:glycoside hydrolase family 15 protein [Planctomyces sp. SH-PL14]AMV19942.1 Glycosyl hydrolases family 15 [Planctomyces sp. SH-PL14]
MTNWKTTAVADWAPALKTESDVRSLIAFLEEQGTFHFPRLQNGLFSAAAGTAEDFETTGYQHIWVRDNMHIAHAHLAIGQVDVAVQCVNTLLDYFTKHRHRMTTIEAEDIDYSNPMNRPHIRFDGRTLSELEEKWAHAQNDALGYFVWLTARLARQGHLTLTADQREVVLDIVRFWDKVKYWEDEDSGHWEEVRKIAASSVGVALAALKELDAFLGEAGRAPVLQALLSRLESQGKKALDGILPAECVQADPLKNRKYDAALLFLIYPMEVVDGAMADAIIANVEKHLMGPIGIRRYIGDSYWCADYKTLLSTELRTADFSDDLEARNALLREGMEAQWCIFDSIISVIYGRRYETSRSEADLARQRFFLERALKQLTPAESKFGPWKLPESYYCEKGKWVPNDITPLLWTQANLRLGLEQMAHSLSR